MVGYLMEYGAAINFVEWMKYGMPFVPLMAVVIGAYMYLRCKPRFAVQDVNPGEIVKAEVARMPKFGGKEAMMAGILAVLVAAWIILGEHAGLGGPTLYAVMAMFLCRIITWDDIQEGGGPGRGGPLCGRLRHGRGAQVHGGSPVAGQHLCGPPPRFHGPGGYAGRGRKSPPAP